MSAGGPGFTWHTVSPAYTITKNISVRAEYSYQKYTSYSTSSANFFGIQTIFKFF